MVLIKTRQKLLPKYHRIGTLNFSDPLSNLDRIEPCIRPLIKALNESGNYETIACCHGHLFLGAKLFSWNIPYILFRSDLDRYAKIWEHFQPGDRPREEFNLYWRPSLSFHPIDGGLVMALHGHPKGMIQMRNRLNQDFFRLEKFLLEQ